MSVIFFEIYWKPWTFDRVIWHENVVNWPNPPSLNFVHICSTVWLTDLFNSPITPRAFPWTCKIRLCHALNVWPSNFTRNPTEAEGWTKSASILLWHVLGSSFFPHETVLSISWCFSLLFIARSIIQLQTAHQGQPFLVALFIQLHIRASQLLTSHH